MIFDEGEVSDCNEENFINDVVNDGERNIGFIDLFVVFGDYVFLFLKGKKNELMWIIDECLRVYFFWREIFIVFFMF